LDKILKWINGIALDVECDIQTKRPYQPNWEFQEIMAFIQSKHDEFMASSDAINPNNQMETISKWKSCYWVLIFVEEWMAYKD
jgi:hypothetical protein